MDATTDDLLAFLCDVDAGDLLTDEWLFPPDEDDHDAQFAPALTLSGGANSAVSCASDTAGHVAVHPSAPPKRCTPKQKLERLHDQVARMTLQLNSLKLAAGIDISTPVASAPCQDQTRLLTVATAAKAAQGCCLWEKLAAKQLKRRRDAEQENRMLREAVTVHSRRAKKLRQMLHKRAADEHRQITSVFSKPSGPTPISLPDDERVYQRLAEGMDEAYAEIDATFRDAKMHEVPVPGRVNSSQGLGPGKWRVELRDVHVMPFEFKQAERAAWVYVQGENEQRGTIRFTFPHPSGGSIVIHEWSITRRYPERQRMVVISRALTEPMLGISIDTTKQIVITSGERSVSGPTTVIQIYLFAFGSATAEAVRSVDGELRLRDRQLGTHVDDGDFGLRLWGKSISRVMDGIEDVLVAGDFEG